jgi:hypothetical protein
MKTLLLLGTLCLLVVWKKRHDDPHHPHLFV